VANDVAEVRRAVMRLARRLRAERPADALSPNKISVLAHLHRNGPTTPGRLAAAEHQQPQTLTRVFAELERAGLIVRIPDEHDRRRTVLDLTSAGRDALAADMAVRDTWLAAAMAELTEVERELLHLVAPLMERLADLDATSG
jgi:DNA-binding MarR family transcriptional regulator